MEDSAAGEPKGEDRCVGLAGVEALRVAEAAVEEELCDGVVEEDVKRGNFAKWERRANETDGNAVCVEAGGVSVLDGEEWSMRVRKEEGRGHVPGVSLLKSGGELVDLLTVS